MLGAGECGTEPLHLSYVLYLSAPLQPPSPPHLFLLGLLHTVSIVRFSCFWSGLLGGRAWVGEESPPGTTERQLLARTRAWMSDTQPRAALHGHTWPRGGHFPWHAVAEAVPSLHGQSWLRLLGHGCDSGGGTEPWVEGDGRGCHLPCVVTSFSSLLRPKCPCIRNQLQAGPDLFKLQ